MSDRTIPATAGIHHVTTLASLAQRTFDFHAGTLGLRLVKRTVNFDDPGTWHLYFGDETGTPGTLLTLFPYEGISPGRLGAGQFTQVSFAVPAESIGYWYQRLLEHGVKVDAPSTRFGERVLTFAEPDGIRYELVGAAYAAAIPGWSGGPVPAEHAIRGIHAVLLHEEGDRGGAELLRELFGFREIGTEEGVVRFEAATGPGLGAYVDLRTTPGFPRGLGGGGTVHHVAFRAKDDTEHALVRSAVQARRIPVTEFVDRNYFHSIYFRTPGGALFEVATDPPGMLIDEPLATLGTTLMLPPQYESDRAAIEQLLPTLQGRDARLPAGVTA